MHMTRIEIWLKGLLAAAISGGAGGVLTGFAAVGIDPQHFNLQAGMGATLRIAAAAALINAVIAVAARVNRLKHLVGAQHLSRPCQDAAPLRKNSVDNKESTCQSSDPARTTP